MRDAGGFWYSIFDWAETVGLVLLFVIVVGVPIVAVILYLGVTTAIEILSDPQVLADIGIGVAVVVAIVGGTVGLAKIL